ncbi:putative ZDHHC-type palmitoyltransferase 6 [Chanos chanos]|uniref:Palmitoyltransferase n=1 Tax=Chanos chanos TaxID=29144 RepID=A0A6J2V4B1_CHACN|nr:putative ZDHHC-type palmitoyltransferase 6 [Chanos chanos]
MPPVAGSGGSGIFESVQRGNIEQVAFLIQSDRTVLKQKGWGGFTALHFAALHGNRPVAELLLNSGADPNIPCDAGQTAFHFASRHGNINIIHKMMQHGADLRTMDHQGKTALHHAVSGGSVIAIQYLWETGMFRFSDTDNFRITPLHIAASTGNTDVVSYLLRDSRCAVDAVDQQGATALHVAAEKGMIEVCWLLLQSAGFHILHVRNNAGLTPWDLCSRGTSFRHQQLTNILSQFMNKPPDQKPKESYVMFYWTLFMPTLSGAVVLLVAAALGEYGGLFCGLFFPWLAKVTLSQYHRMSSYQRLPNPVYLGTLTAGIIHSLVCFYVKILFSIWPAHALLHVSVLHFSLLLGLFWTVLTRNPGQLQKADSDPRFGSIADLVEGNQNPNRFCIYCEIFQVDNCKHCRLCDMCIQDYDHHCLFLNRCVGRDNHRLFVLFIMAMLVGHLIFIYAGGCYLHLKLTGLERSGWSVAVGKEPWVLLLTLLNVVTLAWESWLLTEQFDAIAMGTTTYFKQCRPREHSRRKRWTAVLSFLLEGKRRVGQKRSLLTDL